MLTIGKKMRSLRQAKDWTLADLSKRSGVALSTLSRIETGSMTGTLESHVKIARALGVRLPELYADVDPLEALVEHRRGGSPSNKFLTAKGASFMILTSAALKKKMLPVLVSLQPGKSSQREQSPVGVEKFLYLLKGHLEIAAGEEQFRMSPGDCLYFQASLPHLLKNVGSKPALALSMTCPPAV